MLHAIGHNAIQMRWVNPIRHLHPQSVVVGHGRMKCWYEPYLSIGPHFRFETSDTHFRLQKGPDPVGTWPRLWGRNFEVLCFHLGTSRIRRYGLLRFSFPPFTMA